MSFVHRSFCGLTFPARTISAGCIVALIAIGLCSPSFGHAQSFESPVKLYGLIQRGDPETSISDAELQALKKYDLIVGLDGHGYNFPGALARFRAMNGSTRVLCSASTMDIQADITHDTRFATITREEEAFFHSADPASLRVIRVGDQIHVWFRQDARDWPLNDYNNAPRVTNYIVEYSAEEDGPATVAGAVPETGEPVYAAEFAVPSTSGGFYRVRTRFDNGDVLEFSRPAPVEESSPTLSAAPVFGDGQFFVFCRGAGCPSDPKGALLATDFNNNRVYGEAGELFQSSQVKTAANYTRYQGRIDLTGRGDHFSYRAGLRGQPSVVLPPGGEAYTFGAYNNRVQNMFSSMLVKPNNPIWRSVLERRLRECMSQGFDGMRFDFGFDDISVDWISNSHVTARERDVEADIPAHVDDLFKGLRETEPDALLMFNGFFVEQDKDNYETYLTRHDGGEFEFFAFGNGDPNAKSPQESTGQAMRGLVDNHNKGKAGVAIVGGRADNLDARMKSLVLYLLVANNDTYYCYDVGGNARAVSYFPEWDVPLGSATSEITDVSQLIVGYGVFARRFENGWVLFNAGAATVAIQFPAGAVTATVRGGNVPALGGNGRIVYTKIEGIFTVDPGAAAIVLLDEN